MPPHPTLQKPISRLFRFLHENILPLPLSFFWGAVLLPRVSAQLNLPLFLALAAAGFLAGAWSAGKLRKISENFCVLFSAVLVIGIFLPFRYDIMLQFFAFGFWVRTKKESFPLPFLAPLFLTGGLFTLFFHGEEYRFVLTLFLLLLGEMLVSPSSRFIWKVFRLVLILFLFFLLPDEEQTPFHAPIPARAKTADPRLPSAKVLYTALGSLTVENPNVLVLPKSSPLIPFFKYSVFHLALSEKFPIEYRFDDQYDLIVVDATLVKTNGLAEFLSHSLASRGRLLMPAKECAILPDFYWLTLPDEGAPCRYLLGSKQPFELTPDSIEENLLKIMDESKILELPLAGEISGALVDYQPQKAALTTLPPPFRLPALPWCVLGIWVLLEFFAFRRQKMTEHLLIGESAFAFAAVAALLLENFPYDNYFHGMEVLLPGVALIWLFCRPPLRIRVEILLNIAGMIGALLWSLCDSAVWSVFALVSGGFAFSGEMRRKQLPGTAAFSGTLAIGLALGFLAAWAIPNFTALSPQQALWAALGLKIWTTLRN